MFTKKVIRLNNDTIVGLTYHDGYIYIYKISGRREPQHTIEYWKHDKLIGQLNLENVNQLSALGLKGYHLLSHKEYLYSFTKYNFIRCWKNNELVCAFDHKDMYYNYVLSHNECIYAAANCNIYCWKDGKLIWEDSIHHFYRYSDLMSDGEYLYICYSSAQLAFTGVLGHSIDRWKNNKLVDTIYKFDELNIPFHSIGFYNGGFYMYSYLGRIKCLKNGSIEETDINCHTSHAKIYNGCIYIKDPTGFVKRVQYNDLIDHCHIYNQVLFLSVQNGCLYAVTENGALIIDYPLDRRTLAVQDPDTKKRALYILMVFRRLGFPKDLAFYCLNFF